MKTKWLVAVMCMTWVVCGYLLWNHWTERDRSLSAAWVNDQSESNSIKDENNKVEENVEQRVENTVVTTATIGMTGDVLLHYPIYTYPSFDFAFAAVKEKLTDIDFLLANQESMPAGAELGLSTYPIFNSPKYIIRDLQEAGVDMISMANNHTLDKGEIGVMKSIEHAREYAMQYVGAYDSFEDQETLRIVEVNGIRIGVLAYTYGTNIEPVPPGKDYLVNLIDYQKVADDILRMKPAVDVIVVSLHWGPEYRLQTSQAQDELAQYISSAGADIIFGHHPHVLQRYEEIGETKVFFSLGNFYSAQPYEYTNFGGIARLTVTKEKTGDISKVTIEDPRFFPTGVIKDEQNRFKVVPLKKAGQVITYTEGWVEDHVGVPKW
ncbi:MULTISPECIES: CapA family protein [unclassified Sporosarcina]|uniref:CapA family protein n=1 Tax=unclassified Sporosarcina TaxID=2647733 RepID=UPI00203AD670|nr:MULTISPECIES: CapA family protein [unclassified Sporosarcina]GKV67317.1 capsule biosynthesis protein [Sporosarcina sp. NCCP-2331]GLB57685.1 capsule biosynthesis protein [Sporosarcina sp. NCCP-2378]